ncbi:EthD family reductase [Bacillus aquiflavi]|uniref:EthD family reductase n=1 Tax=Bacillus aquiflavi TaxID=2672567 RepID=A0A6B3W2L8_9BACI|nr:EthD family reductase [Bacillus aquiflavi]MBA4537518.1 EthD family reductase [Bacillus aquiflavi]NEY81774.1 EthD family reductase [Bacillus aquiflavi]UAC47478.1 EthD family reductase [Bacillus aquiflavi]
MIKLIALYKEPKDKEKFDEHYFSIHVPITKKIPGLLKMDVTKIIGSGMGGKSEYYLMCEMYYENMQTFKAAMKTEEAKASSKDLMSFAGDIVTLMIGEDHNE